MHVYSHLLTNNIPKYASYVPWIVITKGTFKLTLFNCIVNVLDLSWSVILLLGVSTGKAVIKEGVSAVEAQGTPIQTVDTQLQSSCY